MTTNLTTTTRPDGRPTTPRHRRLSIMATATVLALIAAACSDDPNDTRSTATTSGASTATATAPASGLRSIEPDALQALVDQSVEEDLIPGAVVLLRTPQGEFAAASGTTERGVERRPDIDTHFRVASNTKTMTAAVILQLAQEGKLDLDDPVSTYVPDVPNGEDITITELLRMRSGLYNYTNSPLVATSADDDPTKVWTPQELLAIAFAQPPNFEPGAEFEYSNTNYVLLGLIAEKLDGKPLAGCFRDRLFGPLDMKDTLLPSSASNTIPDPYSHGYMYGGSALKLASQCPPFRPVTGSRRSRSGRVSCRGSL